MPSRAMAWKMWSEHRLHLSYPRTPPTSRFTKSQQQSFCVTLFAFEIKRVMSESFKCSQQVKHLSYVP